LAEISLLLIFITFAKLALQVLESLIAL